MTKLRGVFRANPVEIGLKWIDDDELRERLSREEIESTPQLPRRFAGLMTSMIQVFPLDDLDEGINAMMGLAESSILYQLREINLFALKQALLPVRSQLAEIADGAVPDLDEAVGLLQGLGDD